MNKKLVSILLAVVLLSGAVPFSSGAYAEGPAMRPAQVAGYDRGWTGWEKAYLEIVQKCDEEDAGEEFPYQPRNYTLSDIDKDGVPELLVGLQQISYSVTSVYTHTKGKARPVGEIEEGHGFFSGIPGENGLLECYEAQGHIYIALWKLQGGGLVLDEILYDEDYPDIPYPHPDRFYPGAIVLPTFSCDDEGGIAMYGIWADEYHPGSEDGNFPNKDSRFYSGILNGTAKVHAVLQIEPDEEDAYARAKKEVRDCTLKELFSALDSWSETVDYDVIYPDLNGDGKLEAVLMPKTDGKEPDDPALPIILAEQGGETYAYPGLIPNERSSTGVFRDIWYISENEYIEYWPYRLVFAYEYCYRLTLPEAFSPGGQEPAATANGEKAGDASGHVPKTLQKSFKVGDVISFGHYEQDNDLSNGQEAIEWYVLESDDEQILLISRYALDCKYFNLDNKGYKWEKCYLRTWLNGTFLKNAFTSEEQDRILVSTVTADVNPYAQVNSGKDTEDKVFLLSYPEFEDYLISDELRICFPTAYAIKQGVRPTVDDSCWWWLRSPGRNSFFALTVDYHGELYPGGYQVTNTTLGVRPVIRIDRNA